MEIDSQLIEGVCGVRGLERGESFKVGLKGRYGLDAGVSGCVWKDGCSGEEGGLGRRRIQDTMVELEGMEGQDGEDEEDKEGEHGKTGLDAGWSRPGLARGLASTENGIGWLGSLAHSMASKVETLPTIIITPSVPSFPLPIPRHDHPLP